MAGAQCGHLFGQLVDPLFRLADEHRYADRHAALPGRAATGADQVAEHLILRCVRHDHHVVLGPGGGLHALQALGAGAVDMLAHRYRADEGHRAHQRVHQQRIDLLAAAMQYLQYADRRAGLDFLGSGFGGEGDYFLGGRVGDFDQLTSLAGLPLAVDQLR